MGIFNFGKPKWYKTLPAYFQPEESTIQTLENFRNRFSLANNVFARMIFMTPWGVKKLQCFMLKKFQAEQPSLSEKEIWKTVIISRMNVKLMTVDHPSDIDSSPLSSDEINNIINQAEMIVKDFKSFDDVVKYIVDNDYKKNRFYNSSGVLDELNRTLNNWIQKEAQYK